jgi:hypothetical protein
MPAHQICRSCGWREPVVPSRPQATRTWDSSRDADRYEFVKKRRDTLLHQRQAAVAELSVPAPKVHRPRRRRGNVVHIAQPIAR